MKRLWALAALAGLSLQCHATPDNTLITQGEYLARAADCMACHTQEGGKPYAGGVKFTLPIGTLYSTNISPDKQYGIGGYSEAEFSQALRKGVAKDGHLLYPAMPYTAYARFSDHDIHALYTYFMQGVPAANLPNRSNDIPWYLAARWPLRVWNIFNAPQQKDAVSTTQNETPLERGAWLVEGPGHCGACHTPRGWMMQEKGTTSASEDYLAGADIEGWYAPSLRHLPYDAQQTALLLKTGHNTSSAVSGPMSPVITHSTQYLTDEDAQAIGVYLASLQQGRLDTPTSVQATVTDPDNHYLRYCSTCHGKDGQGTADVIPALRNNLAVMADNPANLVQVIGQGAQTPQTIGHLSWSMPGYRHTLTDSEIAELTNYVRGRFAGKQEKVTASQVTQILGQQ